jgi:hypothetical protein
MSCRNSDTCGSDRIATITAKCDDRCTVTFPGLIDSQGYVPRDVGIGGGDYVEFSWCLDCGLIQSEEFPIPEGEYKEEE